MLSRRTRWAGLTALAALVTPPLALATPNFPDVVKREVGLAEAPACTLCHDGTPMVGTATTPFATSLRDRGLVFYDEAKLTEAIAQLRTEAVDSDGDGQGDLDELLAGGDPNEGTAAVVPGEYVETFEDPHYGTGCGAAGNTGGVSLFALLALALLVSPRVRTSLTSAHSTARLSRANRRLSP